MSLTRQKISKLLREANYRQAAPRFLRGRLDCFLGAQSNDRQSAWPDRFPGPGKGSLGARAAARRTGPRATAVGRVAGFRRAPFVGFRRLSKPLDFRPKIAVVNFLNFERAGSPISDLMENRSLVARLLDVAEGSARSAIDAKNAAEAWRSSSVGDREIHHGNWAGGSGIPNSFATIFRNTAVLASQ